MKNIVILGSTGSIGTQTLNVVRANKDLKVTALAAGNNIELLEKQIIEFHPRLVCVWDEKRAKELACRTAHLSVTVTHGMDGLVECATEQSADIVVAAIVGMIGIRPVMEAIRAGKDIALANKETLVTAGHIIMPLAKQYGAAILPVDSEHSAIFQCLSQHTERTGNSPDSKKQISRLILTASGGPFRGRKREELREIQPQDALKHPNWAMGKKITIDSSTLVNKGLEVMEAKWLFDVDDIEMIQVVVQPQSIIHSMVEYQDGAVIAQLGTPDMRLPILYALYYPERRFLEGERLDFTKIREITFEEPDLETFPGLALAYQVGAEGGSLPTVYNAANEWAVARFLAGKIKYLEIAEVIQFAVSRHTKNPNPSLEEILAIEADTYDIINKKWN